MAARAGSWLSAALKEKFDNIEERWAKPTLARVHQRPLATAIVSAFVCWIDCKAANPHECKKRHEEDWGKGEDGKFHGVCPGKS